MKCKHDKYRLVNLSEHKIGTGDANAPTTASTESPPAASQDEAANEWTPDEFHERLTVQTVDDIDDVEKFYADNYSVLSRNYGVLLFMYSVLMTKAREN